MNFEIFLRYFLDFSSLYIAAAMCFAPVIGLLKRPVVTALSSFAAISAFSLASSLVCSAFSLDPNVLLLPELILYFILYFRILKDRLSFGKTAFIFLTSALLTAVCVMLSVILNASAEVANADSVCLASTSLICLACEAVVAVIYCLFISPWVKWLSEEFHYERIWRVVWTIPLGFTALYIIIVPNDPATILVNRIYRISIILAFVSFGAFFFSIFLFYSIAREFVRNIQLEQENRLLAIESRRYEQLRSYMERSRHQRHDFRQHIRVISGLAESGKTQELSEYINQYEKELRDERPTLCANAAVDAIAGYYDLSARGDGVKLSWQLELPQKIDMSESDLCLTLGNLIENSLRAVCRLPEEKRRITVICRMLSPAMIGIMVENPYNGEVRRLGDEFLSDCHKGTGTGLASVKSVANKYKGNMTVEAENYIFRVNVLLNL
mgnify:CR=1 FL=1